MKQLIRKCSIILTSSIAGTFLLISSAFADDSAAIIYLKQISDYTYGTLVYINYSLPELFKTYLEDVKKMAQSFNKVEEKEDKGISLFQTKFATVNKEYNDNLLAQITLDKEFTESFLRAGLPPSPGKYQVEEKETDPNALSYSILARQPIFASSRDEAAKARDKIDLNAKEYIANLSGENFIVKQPKPGKNSEARAAYRAFYNSIAAIQSYNAYAVTNLYTQRDNKTKKDLLDLVNDGEKWFSQVATEDLGTVLRHILMFDSQLFVQLDHLLAVQQQQLAAQSMTNTLLVMQASETVGEVLRTKAAGLN